jgi:mRNA interferase RelE/StbE
LYRVVLLSKAKKFYLKLAESDRSQFHRIDKALQTLKSNPLDGNPLKGYFKGKYSLRVGIYRIIYEVKREIITVYILKIGHRKNVYQN